MTEIVMTTQGNYYIAIPNDPPPPALAPAPSPDRNRMKFGAVCVLTGVSCFIGAIVARSLNASTEASYLLVTTSILFSSGMFALALNFEPTHQPPNQHRLERIGRAMGRGIYRAFSCNYREACQAY